MTDLKTLRKQLLNYWKIDDMREAQDVNNRRRVLAHRARKARHRVARNPGVLSDRRMK